MPTMLGNIRHGLLLIRITNHRNNRGSSVSLGFCRTHQHPHKTPISSSTIAMALLLAAAEWLHICPGKRQTAQHAAHRQKRPRTAPCIAAQRRT